MSDIKWRFEGMGLVRLLINGNPLVIWQIELPPADAPQTSPVRALLQSGTVQLHGAPVTELVSFGHHLSVEELEPGPFYAQRPDPFRMYEASREGYGVELVVADDPLAIGRRFRVLGEAGKMVAEEHQDG
jgi:hypothetical protein